MADPIPHGLEVYAANPTGRDHRRCLRYDRERHGAPRCGSGLARADGRTRARRVMIALAEIELVNDPVTLAHLSDLAEHSFGDLVKAVVDVERAVMAIGGELHADEEARMIAVGSRQADLWGINLYPGGHGRPDWIEFDSMINVRPRQGNRSRSVEAPETRQRIVEIVERLVK